MSTWPDAYAEHAAGLRGFLRRRLRSTELAEDLTQETFIRVMRAEDSLRDRTKLKAYLYQTAHRLLLNHLRRPNLVRAENELGETTDLESLAPAETRSSEDGLRERELTEAISRLLEEIPDDQARAFRWAVLEERSYAEIEAHTGWSRSKIKISVFRARKKLMEGLQKSGFGPRQEGGTR